MKFILVLVIFFTLPLLAQETGGFGESAEYEPYEGPEFESHPKNKLFSGIKLTELYNPEADTSSQEYEGYRPKKFTGYTLLQIENTPETQRTNSPEARLAISKILNSAEQAYLDSHREKGNIPTQLLDSVSEGPDRFVDGRSTYVLIVEGTAEDVVRWASLEKEFPKDVFRASLRISKVSFEAPLLPFAMNLGRNPPSLPERLDFSHLKEGPLPSFSFLSSPNYPYSSIERWTHDIYFRHGGAIGGANEVKAFMIRRGTAGPAIDWMPFLVQFLEAQSLNSRSGYLFDRKSGEVFIQGDPYVENWENQNRIIEKTFFADVKRKSSPWAMEKEFREINKIRTGFQGQEYRNIGRFGPIFVSDYYAEVILSTEEYDRFLTEDKPTGLLKMYLRMGFEVESEAVTKHPQYPEVTIAVLKISKEKWADTVMSTTKRPGMKNLLATIEHSRSYPLTLERLNQEATLNSSRLRCINLF